MLHYVSTRYCTPDTVVFFSAVGVIFVREIYHFLCFAPHGVLKWMEGAIGRGRVMMLSQACASLAASGVPVLRVSSRRVILIRVDGLPVYQVQYAAAAITAVQQYK